MQSRATLDFSASFLSQNDEYWTDYYTKPWTRIHGYLIGMLLGCHYFSFKYERDEENNEPIPSKITTIFIQMRDNNKTMLLCNLLGFFLMSMMTIFCLLVNKSADQGSAFGNLLYLLFSRPLFIFGFSLIIMPSLLGN